VRPKRRWEIIILDWLLKKDSVEWIHVAQDRVDWGAFINTAVNFQVPLKTANLLTI
jgi:hypothetical protein